MNNFILVQWKVECLENDSTYKNHITKFIDYIIHIGKANRPVSITLEDVIDCVGFYNKLGKINTIKSMESHLESVKAFYKFLVEKDYATDIFSKISSYQDFKELIIDKYSLKTVKEREWLDELIVVEILEKLDLYFDSHSINQNKRSHEYKRFFKYLALRIFIKLTLIAPAKRSVICSLKKSDFTDDFRSVIINGVLIKVPTGLYRDITGTLALVEQENKRQFRDCDFLFNVISGESFRGENLNDWFCSFLKHYEIIEIEDEKTTYPVEVIMNSAIYQLVRNGTNPAFISVINGTTLSAIEKKFYNNNFLKHIIDIDISINHEINKSNYCHLI
ncbi:integrase [Brevibacillus fluminis]|uniref:integrase n=1 Tax=Brevibacillus fluminis TaxID=511487 RepID=UPI003F8BBF89